MSKFNIQKKDFFILSSLVVLIALVTFVWTNHHYWLKKQAYIFKVPFIKNTLICSEGSPDFMYRIMHESIVDQKSMSNQLAYLDSTGHFYHCESGWEDGFKGNKPITENSRFIYASVSKTLTSALIINLINQNKIHLDQKMVDILEVDNLKDQRIRKITVEMLLQHSAGFDRFKTYTPMLTRGKKPWCPTNIQYLSEVQLDFEPNTEFQYSNVGYCLLGAIVEKVTGENFRDYAEEQYQLSKRKILFVNQENDLNEIVYDYTNEIFYGSHWRKDFDFTDSLSAVGGLSGSAKQMVYLAKDMLTDTPLNILSRNKQPCALTLSEGCFGYALEPFQERGHNFTFYNKSGYFPGLEADLFIDSYDGILTIIRGGSTPDRSSLADFRMNIYKELEAHYINDQAKWK